GEIMVCLVINGRELPAEKELVKKLTGLSLMRAGGVFRNEAERLREDAAEKAESKNAVEKRIVSISVSVNMERTNVIMGKEIRILWGRGYIEDSIRILGAAEENRVKFHISPLSFYQVNPLQTEKLYSLALAYAGLTGRETVWDLYCGIGTISLFLAKFAKKVYGVEVIPQAIEDARENARINGIDNAEFYVGKAEEVLPEKYKREAVRADVIVVDPPRKGCDDRCLETMLAMKPERIVYVSCDSATLARDLRVLVDGGYEVKKVRGVDQFGGTVHVETVCLLSKLNVEHHIEVEVNLDEMDLTKAESKATYEEIKEIMQKSVIKRSLI
ncbi:MAG: 23S rRNA (uracil(1939)-C(5))-methyltransferase RlmD, partial [Lachnospiraceae bacterium]|nr:23S rRNA (uracil(1939)-C(5))-methyltransferase RlmD [Lachnospiraceae bacterium]